VPAGINPSHDHVLLESAQVVYRAVDAGFSEHARRLLEAGRGDKAVGRERCLGNAQQQRTPDCRTASGCQHALVLLAEAEAVYLLLEQEVGIATSSIRTQRSIGEQSLPMCLSLMATP